MSERNPQARDRMRGQRLRAIRTERCQLSIGKASDLAGWHQSKLSRTERGLRPVSIEDIATLLTAWGLPVSDREQILAELAQGSTSGWWDRPIPGVPEDVGTLAGYEAEANELVTVATGAIPGLLQTYETAVAMLSSDGVSPADVETRWMARLRRQQILGKLEYAAYISEAALRVPWGGTDIWKVQLAHLLRSSEIGMGVRVIPAAQTDLVLLHTWHWMRFPHTQPVVQVELASGAVYIHEADRYTSLLERLDRVAVPRAGTRTLITELMRE